MFWNRKQPKKPRVTTWRSLGDSDLISEDFRALTRWKDYTTNDFAAILGRQEDGKPAFIDLATAPHVLIAGATGSGKSVGINTLVASLLVKNSPARLKMCIIDPKMVDYIQFRELPHVVNYCSNIQQAAFMLEVVQAEMMRRYEIMQQMRVNHIDRTGILSHIVIVFDEFASLMSKEGKKALLPPLQEIARLGRAAGVHLILATQRPTRDVIDGQLKANCPARIAYRVSSATDSRVILDSKGAEKLTGNGDGLHLSATGEQVRFQGHMTSPEQLEQIINHWKHQAAG